MIGVKRAEFRMWIGGVYEVNERFIREEQGPSGLKVPDDAEEFAADEAEDTLLEDLIKPEFGWSLGHSEWWETTLGPEDERRDTQKIWLKMIGMQMDSVDELE